MSNQSTKARGTAYELFVQEVYQALLAAEDVETIDVQHNITLAGNSGCEHQIDVYWEFKLAGQLYRTAVECKAFDKSVDVGRVRDFYGVIVDVPNLNGVFATLVGYQRGAKLFAKHYGISLREVRAPTDEDWAGRVRRIHIRLHVVMPKITAFQPRISPAFLQTLGPDASKVVELGFSTDDDIIFDPGGTPVASYEALRQGLPTTGQTASGQQHFVPFPNHTLRMSGETFEIDGVDITYDVETEIQEMAIDGAELAKAIVKDVTSGDITFLDKDNRVRTPRPVEAS